MGFPRQEHWSKLPFSSLGDLPDPGMEPASSTSERILYHLSHLESPHQSIVFSKLVHISLRVQFSSVQSLSHVRLVVSPWTAAPQASMPIISSWGPLKLMSIMLVMPSNHLILCHPLLPPSVFPSIRVFSNELVLRIRWPKYWHFSFRISPSNEYSGLISLGWTPTPCWISL